MAEATIRWVTGKQFVGIDSTGHSVVLSSSEDGIGVKPSEMLLVALGSCSAVDVVGILAKKRIRLHRFEVHVRGEQDPEPPWAYRKIHVQYRLAGIGLTEAAVRQAVKLSQEKYCSVSATLRGIAEITTDFVIESE